MRILIAPDAFKGSLTSAEAAEAMAAGIASAMPDAEIITMPLADGGEGTLDVLQAHGAGVVQYGSLYFDDNGVSCVLIESARLIGWGLPEMQIDVFERGSAGLGKTVLAALDAGVRDIRIALGGSATVDGGLGLLAALGCRVLNHAGEVVSPDLNGMMQAVNIDAGGMDARLRHVRMTILSDVQNPLCGEQGAVCMYGPQKGIHHHQLAEVDAAMRRWAGLCEQAFGISVAGDAGAGAAGGLGFALQLLGTQTVSGAEYVMQACGFEQALKTADWVVTGEGKSDAQTLHGKLPVIVAAHARHYGVNTVLLSGFIEPVAALEQAFDTTRCACPVGVCMQQAMSTAGPLLQQAAAKWADSLK